MTDVLAHDAMIRQKGFIRAVPLFAVAGLIWSIIYYVLGARMAALFPGAYFVISMASLLIFRWHKNFALFRTIQLVIILLIPCLLHLSLGNFISSSAVIIWALICPLGALAFQNTRAAGYWLVLFLVCVTLVFIFQNRSVPEASLLPQALISLLFPLNIAAVTFLIFYLLRYFVQQNELVREELENERILLAREQERSEKLLLNILPSTIAGRLKEGETLIADEHEQVGILFADIVDFTSISQRISPAMLVSNLNRIFTHFDKLVDQYDLEKIKTIGDAYMVASGLNGAGGRSAGNLADFALSVSRDIHQFSLDDESPCQLRIGIHLGSVTAGVIGSKKFTYDMWGDAVNTASRMESFGESGQIQVSEDFYQSIREEYNCRYRGQMEIKGKGLMNLYFLLGKRGD